MGRDCPNLEGTGVGERGVLESGDDGEGENQKPVNGSLHRPPSTRPMSPGFAILYFDRRMVRKKHVPVNTSATPTKNSMVL